jgi:hypothetical protein
MRWLTQNSAHYHCECEFHCTEHRNIHYNRLSIEILCIVMKVSICCTNLSLDLLYFTPIIASCIFVDFFLVYLSCLYTNKSLSTQPTLAFLIKRCNPSYTLHINDIMHSYRKWQLLTSIGKTVLINSVIYKMPTKWICKV